MFFIRVWVSKGTIQRSLGVFCSAYSTAYCARGAEVHGTSQETESINSDSKTARPSRSGSARIPTQPRDIDTLSSAIRPAMRESLSRPLVLACKPQLPKKNVVISRRSYAASGSSQPPESLSWREYLAIRGSKRKWQVVSVYCPISSARPPDFHNY